MGGNHDRAAPSSEEKESHEESHPLKSCVEDEGNDALKSTEENESYNESHSLKSCVEDEGNDAHKSRQENESQKEPHPLKSCVEDEGNHDAHKSTRRNVPRRKTAPIKGALLCDPDSSSDGESENDSCESNDHGSRDFSSLLTFKLSSEEKKKLAKLSIELNHEVPPQHEIERTSGTRHLAFKDKNNFEKYEQLKEGKFSKEEHATIKKNWKEFCQRHGWDEKNAKPFLQMKYKNKIFFMNKANRKKFVQILAKDLPDRSLYSVYQTFKVIFDPHKKCRYTKDEDKILLEHLTKYEFSQNNRLLADLALILKRTRASVWRRCRLLKKKEQISGQPKATLKSKINKRKKKVVLQSQK